MVSAFEEGFAVARSGTEQRCGRLARRVLVLALLTAGWTAALAFVGALAHATGTYGDGTGPAPVRQPAGVLDHTLSDLARTAEGVPRTLHHVIGSVASPTTAPDSSSHVRHRVGDTPRALGRPGQARQRKAAVRVMPIQQHAPTVAPVRAKTTRVVRHIPAPELQRLVTRDEAPTCVPAPALAFTGIPGCSPD